MERILALLTAAVVAACLGVGLLIMSGGAPLGPEDAPPAQAGAPAPPDAVPPESPAAPEVAAPAPEPAATQDDARARVEAAAAAAPDYAKFFTRLRETFPAVYDAEIEDYAKRLAASKGEASADALLSQALRRLRQTHGAQAARAENAKLARVFDMQLEVLKAVAQVDKGMCVAFLYGGSHADFERFSTGRRPLIADMALASLEAMANGEAKKIARAAPTEADLSALEAALTTKGLGKAEIDALLDDAKPQEPPIDDARMCAAGQSYFEALRALPEAARARLYGVVAEQMARS